MDLFVVCCKVIVLGVCLFFVGGLMCVGFLCFLLFWGFFWWGFCVFVFLIFGFWFLFVYFCSCLYPLKFNARCPGHTP